MIRMIEALADDLGVDAAHLVAGFVAALIGAPLAYGLLVGFMLGLAVAS